MSDLTACCVKRADGIELLVRVVPNAAREGCDGTVVDPSGRHFLKIRLRAVAQDGRANAALVALIAKAAGVAKRDVALRTGAASRFKSLHIAGRPEEILDRLSQYAGMTD